MKERTKKDRQTDKSVRQRLIYINTHTEGCVEREGEILKDAEEEDNYLVYN